MNFPPPVATDAQNKVSSVEQELERRLRIICDGAQGTVGLSIVHIESGNTISINGKSHLPLYSVFKLPLAIAVLKDIEENRLHLNQKIHVTPAELVHGTPGIQRSGKSQLILLSNLAMAVLVSESKLPTQLRTS